MIDFRDSQTEPGPRQAAEGMLARVVSEGGEEHRLRAEYGPVMLELGQTVLKARRQALIAARDARQLDDEVLRETIESMDLQEAMMANWEPGRFSD